MNIVADLHTHTIASTHAYSTLTEMVQAASNMNLQAIAITDHGRQMPGSPGAFYFETMGTFVPKEIFGVRVLKGIEANILDYDGNVDCDDFLADRLDWVVASMHTQIIREKADIEKCTHSYLQLAKNKNINVIGHSDTVCFKYDYDKVIPEFAKN